MSDRMLPPNATDQERAIEDATARLGELPVVIRDLWAPDTCPMAFLPWLAWALSVDQWESDWPEATKRAVIAESLELHRRKGTPWAVERALIVAGAPNAKVIEWFDYEGGPGTPYHFKVVVGIEGENVDASTEAKMLKSIDAFKNVRSVLDLLEYNLATEGAVPVIAIGLQSSEIITVYPGP